MPRNMTLARLLTVSAMAVVIPSCGDGGHDCLPPPCPPPMALIIDVTDAATGGPVNGVVVNVSGAAVTTMQCSATCHVPGYGGTYVLDVEAPGFQSVHRTVTVQNTTPVCGCSFAVTEHVNVALAVSPSGT